MRIQCISHGLAIYKNKILVYKVTDCVNKKSFFRLIGGHIDFGESGEEALKREFKEEINQDIRIIRKLDTFENIFFYNGKDMHEFISLFQIKFKNESIYHQKGILGNEGPNRTFIADWVPIEEFKNKHKILYPPNVLDYL
tara:strand:- start:2271 stop:2690 length:420 start_codon:yes stop_codon:yes gene_type:complete